MAKIKYWLLATRPRTLFAGLAPVMIGSAIAYSDGKFQPALAGIIMLASLLIQIITNFINEIYDHKKGADTAERKGPQRMVASGLISPKEMRNGVILLSIITLILGGFIVYYSDYYILLVGVLSLLFAYSYTGGPYPLAYNGLGDIFVLIFFGIIAVCGTYYALSLDITWTVFLASLAPGFLSMNILGVNNYRDIDTDKIANKNTLQVKLGKEKSIRLYMFLMGLSLLVPASLYFLTGKLPHLLPLLTTPYMDKLINELKTKTGVELNSVLAGTGKLVFIHALLTSLAFVLWK